jgi:DNA-binding response OmpR family regulator
MKVFSSGINVSDDDRELLPENDELQGSETVLVVEDEPVIRNLIATTLRQFGYQLIVAEDGEAAIELASKYGAPIHLVIADVRMPRMNGVELVTALRRWFPSIGVLLMSGYRDETNAAMGVEGLQIYFIAKPFTMRALAAATRSAIEWRPNHQPG